MTTDVIRAPWTDEQVDALNRYQHDRRFHPFTCGSGKRRDVWHTAAILNHGFHDAGQLTATPSGWICAACNYTQDWAFTWMLTAVVTRDSLEARLIADVTGTVE